MDRPEVERRYRAMFDQCYTEVLAYALRRCESPASAEDVVAETFLVAWRRIDDLRADVDALVWLLGVARRLAANSRRGDRRRDRLLARLHQYRTHHGTDDQPADGLASDDPRQAVLDALGRLRPSQAEILELATWEQLSHAQIAAVLDCSVNAVGVRLHRARQALRHQLQAGHETQLRDADD